MKEADKLLMPFMTITSYQSELGVKSYFLYSVEDATNFAKLPVQCTPGAAVFAHPAWLYCVFANFDVRDSYTGHDELFSSLLVRLRRGTWGLIVAEPLLILLVVLDPGTAHPVFSLNAPRKVG